MAQDHFPGSGSLPQLSLALCSPFAALNNLCLRDGAPLHHDYRTLKRPKARMCVYLFIIHRLNTPIQRQQAMAEDPADVQDLSLNCVVLLRKKIFIIYNWKVLAPMVMSSI